MKHLGLSGGGTKIGGLFGAAEVLIEEKGFEPDYISGISAGSILSVPIAMRKFDVVRKLVLNFTLNDFFSQRPITKKGNFNIPRVVQNITKGKPYLGKQGALEDTLASVISESDFERYRTGDYPICIVGAIDFNTGARVYFNLKEMEYPQYLKAVNASSSLPIFTNAIELKREDFKPEAFVGKIPENNDLYLYDGGVRDHVGTAFILKYIEGIKESVSVYSRPENYRINTTEYGLDNVFQVLDRYIDISNIEVSKNDEAIENTIAKEKGIKNTGIFLDRKLLDVYDVDKTRLKEQYEEGRNKAHFYYKDRPTSPEAPIS